MSKLEKLKKKLTKYEVKAGTTSTTTATTRVPGTPVPNKQQQNLPLHILQLL
jgi:hypothetical protein